MSVLTVLPQGIDSNLEVNIPFGEMNDEQFFRFCIWNKHLRIEKTAKGKIIIMPPTGGLTSRNNTELGTEISIWNRKRQPRGVVLDSNGAVKLPEGGTRAADVAWIAPERWHELTHEEKSVFPPICPDFIAEIRSPSDLLKDLREKISEFMASGCRLAWLIDQKRRITEIYHDDSGEFDTLPFAEKLTGENVLPGFEVVLKDLFEE